MRVDTLSTVAAVLAFCLAATIAVPAQTFTTLASFDGADGEQPYYGPLVQGTNGNFYGTTLYGGANGQGGVFEITPTGKLTTLYSFCALSDCVDGDNPSWGVVQGFNGNFYATTSGGGVNGQYGTVFELTPAGKLTTLYSFCEQPNCTDGTAPNSDLLQASNGNFYGITFTGGLNTGPCSIAGCGTVFAITPAGSLTTLYSFCTQPGCADGQYPWGNLIQAANGNLYGTTEGGGANNDGEVFEITLAGKLTVLYSFCGQPKCTDGELPVAGVMQAANGNFYGTTDAGGANGVGTVFELTQSGKLTTVYSFCARPGCIDGKYPHSGLVQDADGNIYGTTVYGGANGVGEIFRIAQPGKLTILYSFGRQTGDGGSPLAGLMQATNGIFYGTASAGGADGYGTVYSLSAGLRPFVETQPTAARTGATVIILGYGLERAASVTFNGTAATFAIVSATEIKANVPSGATTGYVTVTTPNGTLTSNVLFHVLP